MPTERERLRMLYREQIVSAEIVADEGALTAVIKTETETFEFPVIAGSRVGFRGDMIGQEVVIGILPPLPTS